MRKLIPTLLIMASLVTASCQKEYLSATDKPIVGEWKWVNQSIGAPNNIRTPQNTGIEETLIFNSNKHWSKIQNNVEVSSGSFKTSIAINGRYPNVYKLNYYNEKDGMRTTDYYQVSDSSLSFSGDFIKGVIGGGMRTYKRIK